jgi:uncharacterized membrane protein
MECVAVTAVAIVIALIFAIRAATLATRRVEALEQRLRSVELLLRAGIQPRAAEPAKAPPPVAPPAASVSAVSLAIPKEARPTATAVQAQGVERNITTRIATWLGAIAFFLAGAFLVKYTFDAGLLGPMVRVSLGGVFGAALIGAGEFLRRRDARIAEGLTAAGIAVLYAATLAAQSLYHFIGVTTGFALLAAITGLAIAFSLRTGPFVALLGLIGGFVTPGLIGSEDPRPGPLFVYFLLLQAGLAGVSRRRDWWALRPIAFAAAMVWVGLWLATPRGTLDGAWLAPFVIASLALLVFSADARTAARSGYRGVEALAALAAMVALGSVVRASGFSLTEWGFVGLLGGGTIVAARLDLRHLHLPWMSLGLTIVLLILWPRQQVSVDVSMYGWLCLGLGLIYGAGGTAALWRARTAGLFGALSCCGGVAAVLLAYDGLPLAPAGLSWGALCVTVAALYAVAAAPLVSPAVRAKLGDGPPAAMLTAMTALASLAVGIDFERRLIPVAWAIEVPLLALLFAWLRVAALKHLSAALLVIALASLLLPDMLSIPIGTTPIWNWLLYGYGVPAVALAAAAWIYHRAGESSLSPPLQSATALLLFVLATLETRHFFHREYLTESRLLLAESSSYVSVWLILASLSALAARGPTLIVARGSTQGLAVLSMFVAAVFLLLMQNPLWNNTSLGTAPAWNLLSLYGLPAVLLLALGYFVRGWPAPGLARGVAIGGIVMLFALVNLEVRQWFYGEILQGPSPTGAELYAYSAAWILFGLALLAIGILSGSPAARWCSLVVMLLAAGKVFLVDTAGLRDLYRVISLLGLGASLMLLAFVYQRFVFRDPKESLNAER